MNTLPAVVRRVDGTEEAAQAFQIGGVLSFLMADGSRVVLCSGDAIVIGPFRNDTTVTAVDRSIYVHAKHLRAGDIFTWRGPG